MASRAEERNVSEDTLVSVSDVDSVKPASLDASYASCDSLASSDTQTRDPSTPTVTKPGDGHKLTTSRLLFAHVG